MKTNNIGQSDTTGADTFCRNMKTNNIGQSDTTGLDSIL